ILGKFLKRLLCGLLHPLIVGLLRVLLLFFALFLLVAVGVSGALVAVSFVRLAPGRRQLDIPRAVHIGLAIIVRRGWIPMQIEIHRRTLAHFQRSGCVGLSLHAYQRAQDPFPHVIVGHNRYLSLSWMGLASGTQLTACAIWIRLETST